MRPIDFTRLFSYAPFCFAQLFCATTSRVRREIENIFFIQGTAPQCWSGEESRVGVSVREKGLAFVGGMSVFKSVEARLRPSKAARAPRWRGLNVNHIVGGWACGPMTKMLRPSQSSHSQSSQRRWRRQNGSWLAGSTVCKGCNNTAVASSVGVGRPRLLGRQRVRRLRHPPLLCGVPQALLSLSLPLSRSVARQQ